MLVFADQRRTWGLGDLAAVSDYPSGMGTGKRRGCSGVLLRGKPQSGTSMPARSADTGRKARSALSCIAREDQMVRGCARGPYRAAEVDERRGEKKRTGGFGLRCGDASLAEASAASCDNRRELDRSGKTAGSVKRPRRASRRWKAVRIREAGAPSREHR